MLQTKSEQMKKMRKRRKRISGHCLGDSGIGNGNGWSYS